MNLNSIKLPGLDEEYEIPQTPEMTIGTEYATTEKYNGKTVYAKAVQLDLSTSGSKYVFIASGITAVVSISGCIYVSGDKLFYSLEYLSRYYSVNAYGNFVVNETMPGTAYITVKYTK